MNLDLIFSEPGDISTDKLGEIAKNLIGDKSLIGRSSSNKGKLQLAYATCISAEVVGQQVKATYRFETGETVVSYLP